LGSDSTDRQPNSRAPVLVDVSGAPYVDQERELAAAFARD
jgi:hypothetical protein